MPAPLTPEKRKAFIRCVEDGMSIKNAASTAGVSYSWARRYLKGQFDPKDDQRNLAQVKRQMERNESIGRPLKDDELSPEALRAKTDFAYFRARYFGRTTLPYHVEQVEQIVGYLHSENKEFVVNNQPPGVGKTTFAHDVAAWMIVNDRSIRGLFGSRVFNNARRQTMRLRRTLERSAIVQPRDEDIAAGLAVEASGCLAADFGIFRPLITNDVWRAEEFVVVQHGEQAIDEKEPTWSTAGKDTGFLGNRYNIIFWDDVDDKTTIRTLEAIENQRAWWDEEAETRLEPRGAMFQIAQRLSSNDLSRYNLDKRLEFDEITAEELAEASDDEIAEKMAVQPPAYHHIRYQAHDEANCQGLHSLDAPPQPEGCLLDPRRLPWREIRRLKSTKPRTYAVQYQQEDADPQSVLVPKVWVTGGTDPLTGIQHPGCYDEQRGVCELPKDLKGPLFSIATVDPSPTKWWAIQWYVVAPNASNQVFLMDAMRTKMGGNELLDWNANSGEWYGVMEDWQNRSVELGHKITHWIPEVNAAQRFLLQYNHMSRWIAHHQTHVMPHTTTIRKLDENMGIDMVKSWWEHGRIRLPAKNLEAQHVSRLLVNEVTRYPNAGTDDQVMAHWFLFANLPKIARVNTTQLTQRRPEAVRQLASIRPSFRRAV